MLEIRGLRKAYGEHEVLRGVDLRAAPGEIVGLLGPNGAGKTTLVSIVAGLRRADAGTVSVGGIDALAQPRARPRDPRARPAGARDLLGPERREEPRVLRRAGGPLGDRASRAGRRGGRRARPGADARQAGVRALGRPEAAAAHGDGARAPARGPVPRRADGRGRRPLARPDPRGRAVARGRGLRGRLHLALPERDRGARRHGRRARGGHDRGPRGARGPGRRSTDLRRCGSRSTGRPRRSRASRSTARSRRCARPTRPAPPRASSTGWTVTARAFAAWTSSGRAWRPRTWPSRAADPTTTPRDERARWTPRTEDDDELVA